jgi:DNA-binding MarR family transcriptional regulator
MDIIQTIYRIQAAYPRIYHACHGQHQNQQTSASGLSQRDATILAHLDRESPITPTLLAKHLGVSKSTMSEALRFLLDKGYVHLGSANDKRSHQLVLTEAGQKAMSAGSVLEVERLSALLSVLSEPELMKALEGLELLAAATFKLTLKNKEEE